MFVRAFCLVAIMAITMTHVHAQPENSMATSDTANSNSDTSIIDTNAATTTTTTLNGSDIISTDSSTPPPVAADVTDVATGTPAADAPATDATAAPTPTFDRSLLRASLLTTDELVLRPTVENDVALFLDPPHNPDVDEVYYGDEQNNSNNKKQPQKPNKSGPTRAAITLPANTNTNTNVNVAESEPVRLSSSVVATRDTVNVNVNMNVSTPASDSSNSSLSDASSGPIFNGFQGQSFIFHGLADEHFNLISSPTLQLNAHLTYIASGSCTYNETQCFSNPGTYMDILGFLLGTSLRVTLTAGSHDRGLTLQVMSSRIAPGQYARGLRLQIGNDTEDVVTIRHDQANRVSITTPQMQFVIINSDLFLNLEVSLLDSSLLRLGARPVTLSDSDRCSPPPASNSEDTEEDESKASNTLTQAATRGWMEHELQKVYGQNQMHGLIGQTWRHANVCGRPWLGSIGDYVSSNLFASDYVYNMYQGNKQAQTLQQQQQQQQSQTSDDGEV